MVQETEALWAVMATADTFKKTVGTCKYIHGFVLSDYI